MSIKIPPSAEIEISDGHSAAAYAVCLDKSRGSASDRENT